MKNRVMIIACIAALAIIVGVLAIMFAPEGSGNVRVKFVYDDGSVISTVEVMKGDTVTAPSVEGRSSDEVFVKWDKSLHNIQKNTTIKAICYKVSSAEWTCVTTTDYDPDLEYVRGMSVRMSYPHAGYEEWGHTVVFPRVDPDNADGEAITTIRENALGVLTPTVKTIVIPHGIVEIGDGAFDGCESLERVILPSTVKVIGTDAFALCNNLVSIEFPEGVKYVSGAAFGYRTNAIDITIDEYNDNIKMQGKNIVSKDNKTFVSYFDFEEKNPVINAPVNTIGEGAFEGSMITSITFSETLRNINEGAFRYCSTLVEIKSPSERLEKIGDEAFYGCSSLKVFYLPATMTEIGKKAFYGTALERIIIPASVTYVGVECFENVRNLSIYYGIAEDDVTNPADSWNGGNPVMFGYTGDENGMFFTVTFVMVYPDGTEQVYDTIQVEFGKRITLPEVPEIPGFDADEWYAKDENGKFTDPEGIVTGNVTVYVDLTADGGSGSGTI